MRLNADGNPVPHRWITAIIVIFCLPGVFVLFPLPAAVLTPQSSVHWVPKANMIACAVAALVFWVTISLLRSWANREQKSSSVLGFLILVLLFTPTAYGLSKATLLRIMPLVSTYIISSPQTIKRTYKYIAYNRPCRRKCALEKLLGVAGASYSLKLPDYPDFVAPITLYEEPQGFRIQYSHGSWPRELPSLKITGPGNWLAVRIKTLSPAEERQTNAALNSTG